MLLGMNKTNGGVRDGEFLTGDMSFVSVYTSLPLAATGVNESLEDLKRKHFLDPSITVTQSPDTAEVWTFTIAGPATADGAVAVSRITIDGANYATSTADRVTFLSGATAETVANDIAAKLLANFSVIDTVDVAYVDPTATLTVTFVADRDHTVGVNTGTANGLTYGDLTNTVNFVEGATSIVEAVAITEIPEPSRTINDVVYETSEDYRIAYFKQFNLSKLVRLISVLDTPVIITKPQEFTKADAESVVDINGEVLYSGAGTYMSGFVFASEHITSYGSIMSDGTLNFDVLKPQLVGQNFYDFAGENIQIAGVDLTPIGIINAVISNYMMLPGSIV